MYSTSQVIEALPEALIGGIYWGLAQVDDGQVYDMVGGYFFIVISYERVWEGDEYWLESFLREQEEGHGDPHCAQV